MHGHIKFTGKITFDYWGWRGFRVTRFIVEGLTSYAILYGIELWRLELIVNNPFTKDETNA